MTDIDITPLFSIPVASTNLSELNHDTLFEKIKNVEYITAGANNALMSKSDHILESPDFLDLKNSIMSKFETYVYRVLNFKNVKFFINCSWANLHYADHWAHSHYHPNSFYSGVYYPHDVDENLGNICFHCPDSRQSYIPTTLDPKIEEFNIINSRRWCFNPKKGDVIIFPSHLPHTVGQNKTKIDRYSIAFNFWIEQFSDDRRSKCLEIKRNQKY